jgi:hypothetical protein
MLTTWAWERIEKSARFWWKRMKERDHSIDRGVDGIRMSWLEIGWESVEWIRLAGDRNQWLALVNAVMNLRS